MIIMNVLFLAFYLLGLSVILYGCYKSYATSWGRVRPGDVVILKALTGSRTSYIAIRNKIGAVVYVPLRRNKAGVIDLSKLGDTPTTTAFSLFIQHYQVVEIDKSYRELYKRTYANEFKNS